MPTVQHPTDGCLRKRVDSDLDKQEKETGPQGCETNPQGRESVFAKPVTPKQYPTFTVASCHQRGAPGSARCTG